MFSIRTATVVAFGGLALIPAVARAQSTPAPADQNQTLPTTIVTAPAIGPQVQPVSPEIQRFQPPNTIESVDQKKIADTVNIVDSEDGIKYLPSVFLRKRNYGDTQAVLATRIWGVNSSARTLVYVDDIPISALISNNNTNGAPRWGMVSPEQIAGMDILYGPFAAEFPGNSIGGVLNITTRQPEKFETTLKQTEAFQTFSMYNTSGTYTTSNSAGTMGGKIGKVSVFASVNREESFSQPLAFITNTTVPTKTTGTIMSLNKTGSPANVVGAGGLLHSTMDNMAFKLAIDVNDWLRVAYQGSYWTNTTFSTVQTYLTGTNGLPTFGGVSGFASNTYNLAQEHLMNALSVKSDTRDQWDFEVVATRYDYLNDIQRGPSGVTTGTNYTTAGTVARYDGTGWSTQDIKAIYRPTGPEGAHEVSFGGHHDLYTLSNPTYTTPNWLNPSTVGNGVISTYGSGNTETWALWGQDVWKLGHGLKATLGMRLDSWQAYGGFNQAGTTTAWQPPLSSTNLSPKATLEWQANSNWSTKFSFGQANRYPTVSELYQIVSTGSVFSIPNPNLLPENALDFEIAIQREDKNSRVRLSLFEEDVSNALISQTQSLNNTFVTTTQNVGLARNRGFELVAELKDVFIKGLTLSNSVTYVDSVILADPGFQSATGTTAVGQRLPYVPDWRDTMQAIYKPNDDLTMTASARYQGKMYSTIDNSDSVPYVMGAFDNFFIVDLHARYQVANWVSADVGIDNLTDDKYFLFHPFPGRTFIASLKLKL